MATFTAPTREQAEYLSREVDFDDAAVGGVLTATAGQSPRSLGSLATVESFLQPIDESSQENMHVNITYINPVGLAGWVRDTIGDTELGNALAAIAADGRAYGFQVRDIKPLIAERLAQYEGVLNAAEVVAG